MDEKPAYYKETIHSQKRRAPWQNYYGRGLYMITVNKQHSCSVFGSLEFRQPEDAKVTLSAIGEVIRHQIVVTPDYNPEIQILDYVVMPDHLHVLLRVDRPMKHHLGDVIQAIKSASTSRIRRITDNPLLIVFEEGFHDRIIKSQEQFEIVRRYIKGNPSRLAVRKAHPEFFRRINNLVIGDAKCQVYGNLQLLDNPFKEQVVVHRSDTEEKRKHNRDFWLYTAANGGVLVSPFISPAEKGIREEAEDAGGRFILIINEPMGERYKPAGRDFELCEAGRLLIISTGISGALTRQGCLFMNALAQKLSAALGR